MKISNIVVAAGKDIHTLSAEYNSTKWSFFKIRAKNAPTVDSKTTLYTQIPMIRESFKCAYTTFLVS